MRILAMSQQSTLSCASPALAQKCPNRWRWTIARADLRLLQRSDAIEPPPPICAARKRMEGATRTLGRPDRGRRGAAARISRRRSTSPSGRWSLVAESFGIRDPAEVPPGTDQHPGRSSPPPCPSTPAARSPAPRRAPARRSRPGQAPIATSRWTMRSSSWCRPSTRQQPRRAGAGHPPRRARRAQPSCRRCGESSNRRASSAARSASRRRGARRCGART